MTDSTKLMNYAIDYLSKYNSSKENLIRILKTKIYRLKIEKKDKFLLYNSIDKLILQLEKNNFLNDKNYASSKLRNFIIQGKSKILIKEKLHIYTRVSSRIQDTDGTSLDTQKRLGIEKSKQLGFSYKVWNEGGASSNHEDLENRKILGPAVIIP